MFEIPNLFAICFLQWKQGFYTFPRHIRDNKVFSFRNWGYSFLPLTVPKKNKRGPLLLPQKGKKEYPHFTLLPLWGKKEKPNPFYPLYPKRAKGVRRVLFFLVRRGLFFGKGTSKRYGKGVRLA